LLVLVALAPTASAAKCTFGDFDAAVAHFSKVLTFATVSDPKTEDHAKDPAQFDALDDYLKSTYTTVWQQLTVEKVRRDESALSPKQQEQHQQFTTRFWTNIHHSNPYPILQPP
jgi:hypothetical protein